MEHQDPFLMLDISLVAAEVVQDTQVEQVVVDQEELVVAELVEALRLTLLEMQEQLTQVVVLVAP